MVAVLRVALGSTLVMGLLLAFTVVLVAAPKGIPDTLETFQQSPWRLILNSDADATASESYGEMAMPAAAAAAAAGAALVPRVAVPGVPRRLASEAASSSAGGSIRAAWSRLCVDRS